jgi:hypothetical protein
MSTNKFVNRWPTLYQLGVLAQEDSGACRLAPNPSWRIDGMIPAMQRTCDEIETAIAPFAADTEQKPVPDVPGEIGWTASTMDLLWDCYADVIDGKEPNNEFSAPCYAELRRRTGLEPETIFMLGSIVGRLFDTGLEDPLYGVYRNMKWDAEEKQWK